MQELLSENASEKAKFSVDKLTVFEATIEDANVTDLRRACDKNAQALPKFILSAFIFHKENMSMDDLIDISKEKSRRNFARKYLHPLLDAGLLEMTIPDKPKHPEQRYRLTDKCRSLLKE